MSKPSQLCLSNFVHRWLNLSCSISISSVLILSVLLFSNENLNIFISASISKAIIIAGLILQTFTFQSCSYPSVANHPGLFTSTCLHTHLQLIGALLSPLDGWLQALKLIHRHYLYLLLLHSSTCLSLSHEFSPGVYTFLCLSSSEHTSTSLGFLPPATYPL